MPASQAGRRRFESARPLIRKHLIDMDLCVYASLLFGWGRLKIGGSCNKSCDLLPIFGPDGMRISLCHPAWATAKGRGMRWDKDNADSIMALGSLDYSDLWSNYWNQQRAAETLARKSGRSLR